MIHSPHFRGYNRAGSERTRSAPDWREQFDIGAERPALSLQPGDPGWKRLQGPNLWPPALPQLRPVLLLWQQEMTAMALRLLRAFAQALVLPADAFDPLYGDKPNEHIKLIRYPGRTENTSDQGVGAHKDSGFLSFLLQDRQRGLQVEVAPGSGSTQFRWKGRWWSTLESCWSWPATAICALRFTVWWRRQPIKTGCRSPSFSVLSWMP